MFLCRSKSLDVQCSAQSAVPEEDVFTCHVLGVLGVPALGVDRDLPPSACLSVSHQYINIVYDFFSM